MCSSPSGNSRLNRCYPYYALNYQRIEGFTVFAQAMQNKKFDPGSTIGIITFHLLAIAAIYTFSWMGLITFLVMTAMTGCLGITLGYHRLLTHRSFEAPRWVRRLLAFVGCLALQG